MHGICEWIGINFVGYTETKLTSINLKVYPIPFPVANCKLHFALGKVESIGLTV